MNKKEVTRKYKLLIDSEKAKLLYLESQHNNNKISDTDYKAQKKTINNKISFYEYKIKD